MAGIFAQDKRNLGQYAKRAKRDVFEIADGRGHNIERAEIAACAA